MHAKFGEKCNFSTKAIENYTKYIRQLERETLNFNRSINACYWGRTTDWQRLVVGTEPGRRQLHCQLACDRFVAAELAVELVGTALPMLSGNLAWLVDTREACSSCSPSQRMDCTQAQSSFHCSSSSPAPSAVASSSVREPFDGWLSADSVSWQLRCPIDDVFRWLEQEQRAFERLVAVRVEVLGAVAVGGRCSGRAESWSRAEPSWFGFVARCSPLRCPSRRCLEASGRKKNQWRLKQTHLHQSQYQKIPKKVVSSIERISHLEQAPKIIYL